MDLKITYTSKNSADGIYKITAKGCIAASLHWADKNGALPDWISFAYVPIAPNGIGTFRYIGNRAIPPEAEYVLARAVTADFLHTEEIMVKIPEEQRIKPIDEGVHFCMMSDLHLSGKTGKLHRAFQKAGNSDCILLAGDMVNDGRPEQFEILYSCMQKILPEKLLLTVAGNHDYPIHPIPLIEDGICDYMSLQTNVLEYAKQQGLAVERDRSGAYAVRLGDIEIIGLNAVTHCRKFMFEAGLQLRWLENYLDQTKAAWHIILCHAPLIAHNPQRDAEGTPYLSRDKELQRIIDSHEHVIFISGHTHISPNDYDGCVDFDLERKNIYINDGSVCPTTYRSKDPLASSEWTDGIITYMTISADAVEISAQSVNSGRNISRGYYRLKK